MQTITTSKTTIRNALKYVQSFADMTPTPQFNAAVDALVNVIVNLPAEHARLVTPTLRHTVQSLIADIEGYREAEWAKCIFMSNDPQATLRQFPYLENYDRIVSREIGLLDASGLELNKNHRMLAIGSGPLPMTALQFHNRRGVIVDQSDIDTNALDLGRHVSQVLDLPGDYLLGAGATLAPARTYDVIFIAVLAGGDHTQKQDIVTNLLPCLKPDGRLLLRSSKGARSIIYPSVQADRLAGTRLLAEAHPSDIVINSSLVFERKK